MESCETNALCRGVESRGPEHTTVCSVAQPGLAFFDGHFEGYPVLPGVALLSWVQEVLGDWLGGPAEDAAFSLTRVRFRRAIRPGETLRLHLQKSDDGTQQLFRFHVDVGGETACNGTLRMSRGPTGEACHRHSV